MANLTGKVALVTGSSKGIGAGIAERLAADGAAVVINYSRAEEDAEAVVGRITAAGERAVAVKANLAAPEEVQPLIAATVQHFGKLDILVNNAGVYKLDTLDTITPDSIDEHFNLNVKGLILTTQAAVKVMTAGAVIVNISSGLAKSPMAMVHVYCSTKGAVDVLTRTFGMELGPRGIRVVGIAPGFVATEGNAATREGATAYLVGRTPLGRIGHPKDIAAVVSSVVSQDGNWITGTTLDVAGGLVF